MRAPVPVALGCISLVLCALELPAGLPRPHGRAHRRREPPDRTPSPPSLRADAAVPLPPGAARPPLRPPPPPARPGRTRGRRHAQLLRVGCVLGTCQVQNLGHRLWQLRAQRGRQDPSPMNPHSPHSYG
ncbi:protein ADM2 [Amazona ochrocephala]